MPVSRKTPRRSALGRFWQLGTTSARVAGGVLRQRILPGHKAMDWQPTADLLRDALGDMKGPVLKLGQMAAQWESVLPAPICQALSHLQSQVPSLPFTAFEQVLDDAYAGGWCEHFSRIAPEPFAAASLGQVHRAQTADGQAVIIKLQYPGMADICRADLQQLRRLLPLGRLLRAPAKALEQVYQELARAVRAELDYARELETLQRYAQHFQAAPGVLIPQPVSALCRPGILVMQEVRGAPLATSGSAPLPVRQLLAERLIDWLCSQVVELGLLHVDPHPGNFAWTPEGELIVYDFGAVHALPARLLNAYVASFRALQAGDPHRLEAAFQQLGARQATSPVPWSFYRELSALLQPQLQPGATWDFAAAPLHQQLTRIIPEGFAALGSLQPAADTLLVNRALEGHYWNLQRLAVPVRLADRLDAALAD
ncbi:ABC1 kinase family protein [Halopseudomonas salegens]|uniref:ABC1 family protein n=1 Tax=Halopseudomonas salegens TaxID=1434072 RepID=A0A1H2E6F3_9GAMM|nr:AarF/ABC1/UbiB kinase family protein [Halopseudomonas salegens]SDT90643.1 ABC1 family protein [Halopseudomonas salegens]